MDLKVDPKLKLDPKLNLNKSSYWSANWSPDQYGAQTRPQSQIGHALKVELKLDPELKSYNYFFVGF